MRFHYVAALVVIGAGTCAVGQTFNVEQPKNNKSQVKVIRPGQQTVVPASTKTGRRAPVVKDVTPVAAARVERTHGKVGRKVEKSVKTAAKAPTPATPVKIEEAKASPPPVKPLDPLEEPLPTVSRLSNTELQQKIQQSLGRTADLSAADSVHVTVTDTEIHLEGTVASGSEKRAAERLAQSFGGNRLFKNSLQIAGSQRTTTAPTNTATTGIPVAVGDGFAGRPKS